MHDSLKLKKMTLEFIHVNVEYMTTITQNTAV